MIWEPFILALVLGIIVSAGLYFAYLWPSVEPIDGEPEAASPAAPEASPPGLARTGTTARADDDAGTDPAETETDTGTDTAAGTEAAAGSTP